LDLTDESVVLDRKSCEICVPEKIASSEDVLFCYLKSGQDNNNGIGVGKINFPRKDDRPKLREEGYWGAGLGGSPIIG